MTARKKQRRRQKLIANIAVTVSKRRSAALLGLAELCRQHIAVDAKDPMRQIRDYMLESGLLVDTMQAAPCGQFCPCAQSVSAGTMVDCYRLHNEVRFDAELAKRNRKILS